MDEYISCPSLKLSSEELLMASLETDDDLPPGRMNATGFLPVCLSDFQNTRLLLPQCISKITPSFGSQGYTSFPHLHWTFPTEHFLQWHLHCWLCSYLFTIWFSHRIHSLWWNTENFILFITGTLHQLEYLAQQIFIN